MPFNPLNIPNREFAALFRAKINANFSSIASWIANFESSSNLVKSFVTGSALPVANQGPIWHDDYASLMVWRTIGAYTGYASINLGSVAYYDVNAAPTGWLECRGQATAAATYAALNALRGSSTLRDLRGEFIRGWDNARGLDAGRAFGSVQGHAFQQHEHVVGNEIRTAGSSADGSLYPGVTATTIAASPKNTLAVVAGAQVATETRPRNIALMPCIKF